MAKSLAVTTGDKILNRRLQKLRGPQQKKAVRKSMRPALKPVQQETKQNAKRHKRTGAFAKSIKIRSMKRSRRRIGARVTSGKGSGFKGEFYGSFIEYDRDNFTGQKSFTDAARRKRRQAIAIFILGVRRQIILIATTG